jgi:signal peptidase II
MKRLSQTVSKNFKIKLYMLISFIILVGIDWYTKKIFSDNFILGESMDIGEYLSLTYVHNYGAAFSFMAGWTHGPGVLLGISIVGTIALTWWALTSEHIYEKIGILLALSGSAGNLIDRWVNGYVIDFIDPHYWPIFNMADTWIVIGITIILITIFINKEEK